ncbi:uncharacterized protein K441DRAFT_28745 [Cenococcum geophilum 1.58]|uniref:uncharacterized protein n=1 Tax=Cenococcum geophilum 1.58 TaxID=794803 RepID=UPI00358FCD74|nr:hypothetical protein K441DRAFT_28745 [Cenococcum geophilum 1.58]
MMRYDGREEIRKPLHSPKPQCLSIWNPGTSGGSCRQGCVCRGANATTGCALTTEQSAMRCFLCPADPSAMGVPDSLLLCRGPAKEPGVVGRGERERWGCRYAGVLCGETRPERATGTLAGCSVHVQCQGPA